MPETKALKAKNNEGGVFTAQLLAAETSTAHVNPVPSQAPGVLTAEPGTAKEEHIYFREKDAVAGTISGLTRDYTNLNGGVGQTHENNEDWETLQATEYINNMVDIMQEGWQEEMMLPTYVSTTSFTVKGDKTATYTKGRIVRFNDDGTKISIVASSSYNGGTGLTTVTTTFGTVPNPITKAERDLRPESFTDIEYSFYGADTGSANTYGATISPAPTRLVTGMKVTIKAANANTGASTFNLNSTGAVAIKKQGGTALAAGDINADQLVPLQYDGTYWQIVGGGGSSSSNSWTVEELSRSSSTVTLSNTPIAGTLVLARDGQILKLTDDYTRSGATITLVDAVGTNFMAMYQVASVASGNADTVDNIHAVDYASDGYLGPYHGGWHKLNGVTLSYSSVDGHTFVVGTTIDLTGLISVGMKIKFTNNSTTFYGFVTAINSTTITLYGGTDYSVANSAITNPYISHEKCPVGFPIDPLKWTEKYEAAGTSQATPSASTWYNLGGSLAIPIGAWDVTIDGVGYCADNPNTVVAQYSTLSTANNSDADPDFRSYWAGRFGSGNALISTPFFKRKHLLLASKTTYYLNTKTEVSGADAITLSDADSGTTKVHIKAVCAYL